MFRLFDSCRKKPREAKRLPKVFWVNSSEDLRLSYNDQSISASFEIMTYQPYMYAKVALPDDCFLSMSFIHDNLNSKLPASCLTFKKEESGIKIISKHSRGPEQHVCNEIFIEGKHHTKELGDLFKKISNANEIHACDCSGTLVVPLFSNLLRIFDTLINAGDKYKAAEYTLNNIKFLLEDVAQKILQSPQRRPALSRVSS